jgi:AcrR family transcriptional regulator
MTADREGRKVPRATWTNLDAGRRERVLAAAMAEFGRHGYSGGSLNVIARDAGVAKGSLFQYFDDKFDFFAYVAEYTSLRVYAAMTPYLDATEEVPFGERMHQLVGVWMDYMAEHPLERGVTAATTMELDPQVRLAVRAPTHSLYAHGLRPLLTAAVERGELAADLDVDAMLSMLVLLLPHLALAPFEPGLDAGLGLFGTSGGERFDIAGRFVAMLLAPSMIGVPRR